MKWETFTIHTTTEAEDLVAEMLYEQGITGVEVRDHMQIMDDDTMDLYEDVMPKQLPDDGLAEVVFYVEDTEDYAHLLEKVRLGLEELSSYVNVGSCTIDIGETEDKDWVNNWKAYFHAFYVDDILIKPTWLEKPADDHSSLMIEIDPGTAFGTGSHETTKLCITGIRKEIKAGDTVLDVGTGSGILCIVALKSGASYTYGTDIDPLAVDTARDNARQNHIPDEKMDLVCGNIISDEKVQEEAGFEKYDLVVANILADVIIPLQKVVWKQMKHGAKMILSGIINLKEEAVKEALLANPEFELLSTEHMGEWASFTVRRK